MESSFLEHYFMVVPCIWVLVQATLGWLREVYYFFQEEAKNTRGSKKLLNTGNKSVFPYVELIS